MRERSLRRSLWLYFISGFLLAFLLSLPSRASAQSAPFVLPPPAPVSAEMEEARFSGKRMFLTALGGALVGSLVAYGTYSALCDETSESEDGCLGAAITGWVANFAVTPAAVAVAGDALGGKGTLWSSYLGAAAALAPFSVPCPTDPENNYGPDPGCVKMQFVVSTFALPITSALMYELSSHLTVERWKREQVQLGLSPMVNRDGRPLGAYAGLGFRF